MGKISGYCEVEVTREFLPAQSLVQELRSLLGLELPQEGGEAFVFLELSPQVDVTRCVNTDPIRWRETGVDRLCWIFFQRSSPLRLYFRRTSLLRHRDAQSS